MGVFSHPVRVYIEDTDAGGIVFYVNYLKYMERARTELMRALGYGKAALFHRDRMFVVVETQVRYLQAARLDDELAVTAVVCHAGGARLSFEQGVYKGETELCTGRVQVACVDRHSLKPQRIPADMLARLQAIQATNGE